MKPTCPKKLIRGFTRCDLITVLFLLFMMLVVLPGFLLPQPSGSKKSARIACVNNLRQVGLAFRVFSNDHSDKFPMSVSTNQGGSLEYVGTADVFRHYLAMTNELNNPKIVTCPSDKSRKRVTSLATVRNGDLSYFIGLDADETFRQGILSGDHNITTNSRLMSGILTLTSSSPMSWTKDIHRTNGNIGFADGSAQQLTKVGLNETIVRSPISPVRLAIP